MFVLSNLKEFIYQNALVPLFEKNSMGFHISLILFMALTVKTIFDLKKDKEIIAIFNRKMIVNLLIISFWAWGTFTYASKHKDDKNAATLESATKKALVALVIAFFAKIDLILAPFWFVWVISYYLDDWV